MYDKKLWIPAIFLCLFLISLFFIEAGNTAEAFEGVKSVKCVETVRIKEGDTLWSIAGKYYTPEYGNRKALIKEIKRSNHIGDTLYIGQTIIVPHYQKAG